MLYGYNILLRPNLEAEMSRRARENLKRAGIAGSKRKNSRVFPDENMRGSLESKRNQKRRRGRGR